MRKVLTLAWIGLGCAIACGGSRAAHVESARPSAAPSAAPSTTASASGMTASKPERSSEIVVVHRSEDAIDLLELDDATLLRTSKALLAVEGDGVRDVTALFDGIGDPKELLDFRSGNFVLSSLSGSSSGELRATIQVGRDESNVGRWFERRAGRWSERQLGSAYRNAAHDESWLSEVELPNGAILYERYDGKRTLLEIDGPKPAVMPALTKGSKGCSTRIIFHSTLRVLADGSLVGAGQECAGKDDRLMMASRIAVMRMQPTKGPLAVESWPKATAKARFDVLPGDHRPPAQAGPNLEVYGEPDDLWLTAQVEKAGDELGATYVAHFDGVSWKDVTPACELPVSALIRSERVFVFCGDRGFRRDGETWTALSVPIHGPHLVFGPVVAVGKNSVFGLAEDALYRYTNDRSSFARIAIPEIDGAKLRGRQLSVSRKGDLHIVAVAPGRASFVLRYVGHGSVE